MENSVNNIELLVTLPAKGNELSNSFKIKSLDILYKESDQTTVKVLETIPVGDLSNDSINNIYTLVWDFNLKSQESNSLLVKNEMDYLQSKI